MSVKLLFPFSQYGILLFSPSITVLVCQVMFNHILLLARVARCHSVKYRTCKRVWGWKYTQKKAVTRA